MKKLPTTLLILLFTATVVLGQERVKERYVKGEWKMIIDIDFDEIEEEMEEDMEEDSWFGWAISGAVSGFVEDVIEEIDITVKFMDGGKYKLTVIAFDEEEIEYGEWFINRNGELIMIDEDDDEEDDDVWLMKGDDLVSYQKTSRGDLERQEVFMRKL